MELFDKKFVYLEWDDVLEGKKVFVADTLPELRRFVECDYLMWIVKKHGGDYPFVVEGSYAQYAMVYYDPNYECKIAYKQGKVIQCKLSLVSDDEWEDCIYEPEWVDHCEYRVKPEDSKCNTCSYQCEPDMPCVTCRDGSNYKPRIVAKPIEDVTKKKRRMTNRELARWLAEGNGEWMGVDSPMVKSANYSYSHEDCPVVDGIVIRGWDETECHEPEVEV